MEIVPNQISGYKEVRHMEYIAETLGIKTAADDAPWAGASRLQYFLTDAYGFAPAALGEIKCLFVKPKGELAAISAVKKHLGIIAKQAGVQLILDAPVLDAKQRKALIAARIPFVVDGNQLYLPFLGAALQERYAKPEKCAETLSPTAQRAGKFQDVVSGLREELRGYRRRGLRRADVRSRRELPRHPRH
jgi:hypothetical protein